MQNYNIEKKIFFQNIADIEYFIKYKINIFTNDTKKKKKTEGGKQCDLKIMIFERIKQNKNKIINL